ncbi:MAG: SMP-30/gluconolactonase/LRE family protein [Candidatus Bathyarchaeota archaeon]|nr:SMP-30/gluconolactonase/LRE family protein [Candidatus Bathyarchaeota archaeon]
MSKNPIDDFKISKSDLKFIGKDLQRPECILVERDGTLWAADARGGVVKILPDGKQEIITQSHDDRFSQASNLESRFTQGTLPNGLAFAENGDFLIANFGKDLLEVMTRDGKTRTLYDNIDGEQIGKVNFVLRDSKNRIWLTISTKVKNWVEAFNPNISDGYIAVVDQDGIRVAAEGFKFTNEIRFDAKEEYLYIVETNGRRISRMRSHHDGTLSDREVFGPSDLGGFPDGIAFDSYGNLWGTLIYAEKIFALTPEGELRIILDDGNPEAIEKLDRHFFTGKVQIDDMIACGSSVAPWMASITFGGQDLKTVYVGTLKGTTIPYFTSPVAGLPMVHW